MRFHRIADLTGQHFIVASTAEGNEPSISTCAIEVGRAGLWPSRRASSAFVTKWCPYPGISVEYFLLLAYMMNFTFEVRTPKNGSYGKQLEDGRWDGVVGMLATGEADMSFHPLFMTAERSAVIHYGPVVYDRPLYGFLYQTQSGPTGTFSVLSPLNWMIYTGVAIAFVFTFIGTLCLAFYDDGHKRTLFETAVEILWAMAEMDAGILRLRFPLSVGILLFGWFLASYTLSNAYRSNLIVSAIGDENRLPIRNLDDAVRLFLSNELRLVVPKDNLQEFYNVLEALPSVSVDYEPWAKLLANYTPATADDAVQMAKYLSERHNAFFGDVRSVTWMFAKNPLSPAVLNLDVTFVKTAQGAAMNSLGFRKDFPFKEAFESAMMITSGDTIMNHVTKAYFPERYRNAGAAGDFNDQDETVITRRLYIMEIDALNLPQLLASFWFWFFGCALATVVFLTEICIHIKR